MAFEPGNQAAKGRTTPKEFSDMLRIAIKEANAAGGTKLREVAQALVDKAITGDVPAIKEIADRLDGKVPQQLQGDSDKPFTFILQSGVPRPDDGTSGN